MTVAAEPIALPAPVRTSPRRASAVLTEALLVGGATLLLFPLSWALRGTFGLDESELAVGFLMFHAAHVINDPHFCVTYLLFYEDVRRRALGGDIARAQRLRWIVVGVVAPIVLVTWAGVAIATRSAQTLGWMVQLMFLLVGWHYVKQGFGVLSVLSARRDVRFSPTERTTILAHCYAAWAYAWASPSAAAGEFIEKGVVYWAPARPEWFELVAAGALACSTLALVRTLFVKWRRDGALPLVPLGAFLITVWAWTIYSSIDPLVRYVIPALHSIQYLYFVWLMKRNQAREAEAASPFGPRVGTRMIVLALSALALGWVLLRGGPAFLDGFVGGDDALGATPFFAAFFVVINVHHYLMDHVIWRRESPQTRYLREGEVMELLVTIGLDEPVAAALNERLEARVVSYPTLPLAYAIDGRMLVESARIAGRMLEPRGVVFYSYFDAPESAAVRRALALSDVPTFPDVRRTLVLDDKAVGLVAALGAGVPRLARGFVPPGEVPAWDGERVLKWGQRHCGDDKVRASAPFVAPEAALVEPFVEGTSERVLIVGEHAWHLDYTSEDWRKNVGASVAVRDRPDPALLSQARRIATHLGLAIAGIDFVVRGADAFLLEVNAYPGLDGVSGADDAFLELADAWWRDVIG